MPVIHAADATVHHLHDTSFTSYASPSRGSRELCGWRIEIPAGTHGVPHHVSHEEVLYILAWVTTSVGFAGVLPDGSRITPPWTL